MTVWYRNRFVWVAVIVLATVGALIVVQTAGSDAEPARQAQQQPTDLQGQIVERMRTTLEQADPGQHNHAGHGSLPTTAQAAEVVCGIRVYGFEPDTATTLAEVKTVYGFHLCGVAEQKRPWDVAVKLAGPVIMDMAVDPPGIQVVEATAEVMFIDRLRQMFPPKYLDLAQKEALVPAEMTSLRRRYDAAAGL